MSYPIHTLETAPDAAKESLEKAGGAFGFIPNILGMMAESPALLKAYLGVAQAFQETAFDATERQIVLLTTSYENECPYCMAAHSTAAARQKVPEDVIAALRDGTPIADAKLEALRAFTSAVVTTRGWPSAEALDAFEAAGYPRKRARRGRRRRPKNALQLCQPSRRDAVGRGLRGGGVAENRQPRGLTHSRAGGGAAAFFCRRAPSPAHAATRPPMPLYARGRSGWGRGPAPSPRERTIP